MAKFLLLFLFSLFSILLKVSIVESQSLNLTFTNPILDRNSADPCILKIGDSYYLSLSENKETELWVYKSNILTSFRNATSALAFKCEPGLNCDSWASEMHIVDNELFMYYTMRVPEENMGHRMFVLKANDPQDPLAGWSGPIRLFPNETNYGGIDGTVFNHGNGQRYYVWTTDAKLWIAPMISPTLIGSPKINIRDPDSDWECWMDGIGDQVCKAEGPFFIYNRNMSYLIFSGGDERYCLGQLSIPYEKDPMIPGNWDWNPQPVFYMNPDESVLAPGHAAFTLSPDESETWMVYHAHGNETTPGRIARIEKITWNEVDGSPVFPKPSGYNHIQNVPSGQTITVSSNF